MPTILANASALASLRSTTPGLTILDVRLPEDFAIAHLPSSINQCVFEMVFLDELLKKGIRNDQPICVYGADEDSHESRMAVEKLERAGYTQVYDFRGGLSTWRTEEYAIEGSSSTTDEQTVHSGRHEIDLAESNVVWVGRNLINKHWGQVMLSRGHVEFADGKPTAGAAVLDMQRISSTDLAGSNLHDMLIHHLEGDDFFDVARFPEAEYAFDHTEICSDKVGCNNLKLHGKLTLRGITKPLVIEATAGFTPDGKAALQSTFSIDRTEWGSIYGSGKFFRNLAGHLVNDRIELQLRILTAAPVRH